MTETVSRKRMMGAFALETDLVAEACTSIVNHVAIRFCLLQPGTSVQEFFDNIVAPIENSTPDAPATVNYSTYSRTSQTTFVLYMKHLIAAVEHCTYSERAYADGKESLAWRHISNAMYNLGMFEGAIILEPAIAHIVSARAKSGSVKRTEKYIPLRERARELASKKTHMTKRAAVFAIMADVVAKADELGVTMSPTQQERTITSWLEGMSFGSKRQP